MGSFGATGGGAGLRLRAAHGAGDLRRPAVAAAGGGAVGRLAGRSLALLCAEARRLCRHRIQALARAPPAMTLLVRPARLYMEEKELIDSAMP